MLHEELEEFLVGGIRFSWSDGWRHEVTHAASSSTNLPGTSTSASAASGTTRSAVSALAASEATKARPMTLGVVSRHMGQHDCFDLSGFSGDVLKQLEQRGIYDPVLESWANLTDVERREKLLVLCSQLQERFNEPPARDDDSGYDPDRVLANLEYEYLHDQSVECDPRMAAWEDRPVHPLEVLHVQLERYLREGVSGSTRTLGALNSLTSRYVDADEAGWSTLDPHSSGSSLTEDAEAHVTNTISTRPHRSTDMAKSRRGSAASSTSHSEALRVLRWIIDHDPRFHRRDDQETMCLEIEACMEASRNLPVNAGTGIGKSLAYLVPAALCPERVVVAAWTKNLQDQLLANELPRVATAIRKVTGRKLNSAVLKGKENYCCRERLTQVTAGTRHAGSPDAGPHWDAQLTMLSNWATDTRTGDLIELHGRVHDELLDAVSGKACQCSRLIEHDPEAGKCFVLQARSQAEAAHLLVVNHHLYAVHLRFRGRLLPEHKYVIIDEAHSFSAAVTDTAGLRLSKANLDSLAELLPRVDLGKTQAREFQNRAEAISNLLARSTNLRIEPPRPPSTRSALWSAIVAFKDLLEELSDRISLRDEQTPDLFAIEAHVSNVLQCLHQVTEQKLSDGGAAVAYVSGDEGSPTLCVAPIFPERFIEGNLRSKTKVILSSATIDDAVVNEFGTKRRWLDILELPSPFDYEKNSLLYISDQTPHPSKDEERHWEFAEREMKCLIKAIEGRTLVLFTSWRALIWTHNKLEKWGQQRGLAVLRQDDDKSPLELVAELTPDRPTVVCATMKFWQGVDVRGDGLQLIILHKLPFLPYDDPLYQARKEALNMAKLGDFSMLQIPHAQRMLAQGIGRLIRTSTDRGVAAVLDDRFDNFDDDLLALTPDLPITRDKDEAVRFLRKLKEG